MGGNKSKDIIKDPAAQEYAALLNDAFAGLEASGRNNVNEIVALMREAQLHDGSPAQEARIRSYFNDVPDQNNVSQEEFNRAIAQAMIEYQRPTNQAQSGYPQQSYFQPSFPQPGVPQPGYYQPGFPQPGYSQMPGVPAQAYPLQGDPQPGYAPQGSSQLPSMVQQAGTLAVSLAPMAKAIIDKFVTAANGRLGNLSADSSRDEPEESNREDDNEDDASEDSTSEVTATETTAEEDGVNEESRQNKFPK